MSFKRKFATWFLFLLVTFMSQVWAAPITDPDEGKCNLPAPVNFHITKITTTSISVVWNLPVALPHQYNIKVTEQSSGNVVFNQNFPGTETAATIPGLLPGTTYVIRNTPVCEDGSMSPNYAETVGTTTIVELITVSFSPSDGSLSCAIEKKDEFCYADPAATYLVTFLVKNTATLADRYFGVYVAADGCTVTSIVKRSIDNSSPLQFYNDNGKALVITDNGDEAVRLLVQYDETNTKALLIERIDEKHTIQRYGSYTGDLFQQGQCDSGDPGKAGKLQNGSGSLPQVNTGLIPAREHLNVAPNPFGQYLEIALPASIQTDTKITLYGPQGRQVLQQSFAAGSGAVRLETGLLEPGFYFLQAESAEFSETIKVVKTR